jgi:hypothetical protein
MRSAFAVPIRPGQAEACRRWIAECAGPRRAAYEDMQRRTGVTEEAYWLQTGPEGDILIVTSHSDQRAFNALMLAPETDFDRWFRAQIETILGFDPAAADQAAGHAGPPPEQLLAWHA